MSKLCAATKWSPCVLGVEHKYANLKQMTLCGRNSLYVLEHTRYMFHTQTLTAHVLLVLNVLFPSRQVRSCCLRVYMDPVALLSIEFGHL